MFTKRNKPKEDLIKEKRSKKFDEDPSETDTNKYWLYQIVQQFIRELGISEKAFYKMNYIHSLNWMSMWKQRDDAIRKEMQKQKVK